MPDDQHQHQRPQPAGERGSAAAPAAERVYAFTKELILGGDLPGGSLISENEIAGRAGVSRTPVREAFLRLQGEELLRLHPKRGAVVVPLAPGEAEDVLELREALETSAVRRLHRRDDQGLAAAVEGLRTVLREQAEPAKRGDVAAFVQADQAFHRAIVSASGNGLADRFYVSLGDRQRRMNVFALNPRPDRLESLVGEHEELVGHIARRDSAAFATGLRTHLNRTHGEFGGS